MQSLFKDKIVAFNMLVENNEIIGYVIVSKNNAIFYSEQVDILNILKSCKRVLFFNFGAIKSFLNDFTYKDDLMALYFQIKPQLRFNKNLDTIMKNEFFVAKDLENVTYLKKHQSAEKCIEQAKFIYEFYTKYYKESNKEILKIDQALIRKFYKAKTIKLDRVKIYTELSLLNKTQWDIERELWKKAQYPFLSIKQLPDSLQNDEDIIDKLAQRFKIKAKYTNLVPYMNQDFIKVDMDFAGSSTGRIICRANNSLFAPDNEFKDIFIAQEGKTFISCDYSRQEGTIIAAVSKDEQLSEDLLDNKFYAKLAFKYFKDKNKELGKTLFYGILYGSTAASLSKKLSVSLSQTELAIKQFKVRYKNLHKWLNNSKSLTTNYFGRKLYTSTANAYIQSTAADLVRIKLLQTKQYNPILVFSDNIIYRVDEQIAEQVQKEIIDILEEHETFKLQVKSAISNNLKF